VKRLTRTLGAAVFALWAFGAEARDAAAQAAPAAQSDEWKKEAARELATKGYTHFEAGEYGKALQYFKDAEARFHAPTLLALQAKTHLKLGQYVEARDAYQRIVDEQLAPDAPKEFHDAQAEAKQQVDLAAARIATLKIALKGMVPEKIRLTIDDVEIPTEKILTPLPQNPGTHKIVATLGGDEGGRAVYQSVTLKEGTTKQIQLVFRPGDPAAPPPSSGGCASCEVHAPRGDAGAPAGVGLAVAAGLLATLRRRRRGARPRISGPPVPPCAGGAPFATFGE
jgi:hypothetical protein